MHDQETPPWLIGTPISTMPPSSPQYRRNFGAGTQRSRVPLSSGGQKHDCLYITASATASVADIGILIR